MVRAHRTAVSGLGLAVASDARPTADACILAPKPHRPLQLDLDVTHVGVPAARAVDTDKA